MAGKQYNFRNFIKILESNGYKLVRTNGSHYIYSNGHKHISINTRPNAMVCKRLIKENNLLDNTKK